MREVSIFDLFKSESSERFLGGIFLTYGFDAELFEKYVLPILFNVDIDFEDNYSRFRYEISAYLRQAPILVMADGGQYTGGKTFLYDLKLINSSTFHPKVFILLYQSYLRVVIGSSNITKAGMCYNGELLWCCDFKKDNKYSQISELKSFFMELDKVYEIRGCGIYSKIIEILKNSSGEVSEYPKIITTLSQQSILECFCEAVKLVGKNMKELNLVSPFFEMDREMAIEKSLIMEFFDKLKPFMNSKTKVNFYFPGRQDANSNKWIVDVPENILNELNKEQNINYNVVLPVWKSEGENFSRQLHAKLLSAVFERGETMYLMGSPNFTTSAMKSNIKFHKNVEVGLMELTKEKFDLPEHVKVKLDDLIIKKTLCTMEAKVNFIKNVTYSHEMGKKLEIEIDIKKASEEFSIYYDGKELLKLKSGSFGPIQSINNFKLKLDQDLLVVCDGYSYYVPIMILDKHLVVLDNPLGNFEPNLRDIISYYAKGFRNPTELLTVARARAIKNGEGTSSVVASFRENLQSFFKAIHVMGQKLSEPCYDMIAFHYELNNELGASSLIREVIKGCDTKSLSSVETCFYLLELKHMLENIRFKPDDIPVENKKRETQKLLDTIEESLKSLIKDMPSGVKEQIKIMRAYYGGV